MSAEQELSFGVETITPEIAAAYLKRKGANRNISHLRVQRYAREMQRGDWLLTGEAIKFCNGQLMDGQQRLLAVIESGVSVRMPVIRGIEHSAFEAFDTGKARLPSDLLASLGFKQTRNLAAAARVLLVWEYFTETGSWPRGAAPFAPTPIEAKQIIQAHPGLQDWVRIADQLKKVGIPGGVGMWAGHLYWLSLLDDTADEDAKAFAQDLATGTNLEANDPILVLRNKLLATPRPIRQLYTMTQISALIIKAWNSYRKGEPMTQLKWSQGGARPEPFPKPV